MDDRMSGSVWLRAEASKIRSLARRSADAALSAHLAGLADEFDRAGLAAMPEAEQHRSHTVQ